MKNKSMLHWLTLTVCCFLAAGSVGIQSNSYGVFYTSASNALGVGQGVYSLHATCSNLCMGLFCPLAFKISKKYGLRKCILASTIVVTLCTAAMGIGNSMGFFYGAAIIRGIGNSFLAVAMVSVVVNNWFEEKHGFANGLTLSFSGLSGALFSPLFSGLITSMGWRNTYFVMAGINLVLALPAGLFLHFTPEEKGLLPYGAAEKSKIVTASEQKGSSAGMSKKEKMFLVLLLFFTMTWNLLSGIPQYFVGLAESIGFSAAVGAWMVSAAMVGNITSKLLIGMLSDRIGAIPSCMLFGCINLAALFGLMVCNAGTPMVVLMAAAFFYGTVYAVTIVGTSLLSRTFFGKEQFDRVYPIVNIAIYLGGALALPMIGTAYDMTGSYRMSMLILAVLAFIDLFIILIMQKNGKGDK